MANLFRCGGRNKFVAGTLNNYAPSSLTYYIINCGGVPKGFFLHCINGSYNHEFFCDLADDVLMYDGTAYSAKSYVEIIGNTLKLNISSTLGTAWMATGYGYR